LSLKTKLNGLLVVWPQNHWYSLSVLWPQNQWGGFLQFCLKIGGNGFSRFSLKTDGGFLGLASKPRSKVSSGLTSKPMVARVFCFGHQNRQLRFGDLCLKITAMVYWFRPKNQADFSLSVAPQN
jgi:hypothetical protein